MPQKPSPTTTSFFRGSLDLRDAICVSCFLLSKTLGLRCPYRGAVRLIESKGYLIYCSDFNSDFNLVNFADFYSKVSVIIYLNYRQVMSIHARRIF